MDQNIDLEGRFDTPGRILRDAVAAVLEGVLYCVIDSSLLP